MDKNDSWIETFTGKKFNFFDVKHENINIKDIAHSLALQCRFNGHCEKFYSVAEHCVNTADYVLRANPAIPLKQKTKVAFFALLHDASETYLCDIPRPLKPFLQNYSRLEKKIMKAIFAKFAKTPPTEKEWKLVMDADNAMLRIEAESLTVNKGKGWNLRGENKIKIPLPCLPWKKAEKKFLRLFEKLKSSI